MNTLRDTLLITCLIVCAGCGKHSSPPPNSEPAVTAPSRADWKYQDFTFQGSDYQDPLDGKRYWATLIFFGKAADGVGIAPEETNEVSSISDILNAIGKDGWQYVSNTGEKYLVRRATGQGSHSTFLVQYLPREK
jgi:hypothetical protein